MKQNEVKWIDYSELEGGLSRMLNRFKEEGTLTKDLEADEYLRQDPNAALLGLLYDQRVLAESAFTGPIRLKERLGHLDMRRIADMDPEEFKEIFGRRLAVHRFINKMADMTQEIARIVADRYDGDASKMWNDGAPFAEVHKRIIALPGFGKDKARKMRYVLHYFGYRDFSNESKMQS